MIAFLAGLLIGALAVVIFLWKKDVITVDDVQNVVDGEKDDEDVA